MTVRMGNAIIAGSNDIDDNSITTNNLNKIQATGVIDQNSGLTAIKSWVGTLAEYNALNNAGLIDNNTLYNITDDYETVVPGGLEIGDIGICALGIDETQNKRRYLNGQVISQAQFESFTDKLKSIVALYPNLATTEVNWQAEVTNSALGQCGKFVIDDVAGTIRLPKVVNINGLQNLTGLGTIKAESLPNIKGTFDTGDRRTHIEGTSGALYKNTISSGIWGGKSTTGGNTQGVGFDASLSSSTYQDDAPVQQEAVQYPYFIQVAEGVETSVDVSREIELNNPFSLLDYKYSEYEISNASWLLSNSQWNSGAVYQSVYDLLLQIYNGTVTKAGVSVKLSTETYADTDFVLNTSDTTFRLPLKVALASGKAVAGNGITLGLTNGTDNLGTTTLGGQGGSYGYGITSTLYGRNVGSQGVSSYTYNGSVGVTTDPEKSGIETSANGLYLYFYVGETVQDANIIAAGQALTDIADLKNASNFSSLGKETIAGWGMPDYTTGVNVPLTGITSFVAPYDCEVCYMSGLQNTALERLSVNGEIVAVQQGSNAWVRSTVFLKMSKGDILAGLISNDVNRDSALTYYKLKGVN